MRAPSFVRRSTHAHAEPSHASAWKPPQPAEPAKTVPSEPLGPEMFAGDGFHPSPALHAAFADAVMAGLSLREDPAPTP